LLYRAGIFKESMGARNPGGTGPPGYIGWRNSLESIPGLRKRSKITAQYIVRLSDMAEAESKEKLGA
jgi:hypothetical protein